MIQPVRKFKDEKRNKIAFTEGVQDGFLTNGRSLRCLVIYNVW